MRLKVVQIQEAHQAAANCFFRFNLDLGAEHAIILHIHCYYMAIFKGDDQIVCVLSQLM